MIANVEVMSRSPPRNRPTSMRHDQRPRADIEESSRGFNVINTDYNV
jgi:hypothetical protein